MYAVFTGGDCNEQEVPTLRTSQANISNTHSLRGTMKLSGDVYARITPCSRTSCTWTWPIQTDIQTDKHAHHNTTILQWSV